LRGWNNLLEMNRESVSCRKVLARLQMRLDVPVVDPGCELIRREHHDDVAMLGRVANGQYLKAGRLSFGTGRAVRPQSHDYIAAVVLDFVKMWNAVGAIPDDGNSLARQVLRVGILIVINFHISSIVSCRMRSSPRHHSRQTFSLSVNCENDSSLPFSWYPLVAATRVRATVPVRTIS